MSDKLTTKQRLFVEAYLANANGVQAARKAGYVGDENTLAMTASRLIRNDKVSKLINKRIEKAAMTADEWLAEVAALARQAEKDSDRLTAYGLLGKPLNLTNNSKVENSGEVTVTVRSIEPGDE